MKRRIPPHTYFAKSALEYSSSSRNWNAFKSSYFGSLFKICCVVIFRNSSNNHFQELDAPSFPGIRCAVIFRTSNSSYSRVPMRRRGRARASREFRAPVHYEFGVLISYSRLPARLLVAEPDAIIRNVRKCSPVNAIDFGIVGAQRIRAHNILVLQGVRALASPCPAACRRTGRQIFKFATVLP